MKYINHFTLTTGNNRKSYPSEINKEFFFKFKSMVNKIIENGGICEYIEGLSLKITPEGDDQYAASVYIKYQGQMLPILFSLATSNPLKRDSLIKSAIEFQKAFNAKVDYMPPAAPLIIDIIMLPAALCPEKLHLTGDLSRCLAWTILDPQSILEQGGEWR